MRTHALIEIYPVDSAIDHLNNWGLTRGVRVVSCLRGCLHDTGATFAPEWVHSGSLSWLYICLHDTTTKCHAGASHPGVSSPRLLYRGENFSQVRSLATVSWIWPHVSMWNRSAAAGRLERVAHAYCFWFWVLRVFYQHEVYLQISRYEMTQSWCERDTK